MHTYSTKKSDSDSGLTNKKEAKRKREPSVTSDVEKTPPPSPEEEEDEDDGVQVTVSSFSGEILKSAKKCVDSVVLCLSGVVGVPAV